MGAQAVRLSNVDINNALKNREFEVLFQPIFDLGNGALARMETFVRWQHPSLGALPPGAFVSFFENQGRMSELTRYVVAEALNKYVSWRGAAGPGLSINLAMSDLSDETFAPHFEKLLRDAEFPIDLVTLECPMPPVDMPLETSLDHFQRLGGLGARLAIEVRGRANEFLRALDPFPFDEIKTGGASILRFARTVRGPGLSAISDLLDIASKANAAITAVGVEDQASLSALRGLGFTAAQGNHLANVGELSDFRTGKVNEVRELLGIEPLSQDNLSALFRTDGLSDEAPASNKDAKPQPVSGQETAPASETSANAPAEPSAKPTTQTQTPTGAPKDEPPTRERSDDTLARKTPPPAVVDGASSEGQQAASGSQKSSLPATRASTIDAAKRARARERAKAYALAKRAKARRMRKEAAIERVKSRAGLTGQETKTKNTPSPIDVEATDLPPVQANPAPRAMQDRLTKEFGSSPSAASTPEPEARDQQETPPVQKQSAPAETQPEPTADMLEASPAPAPETPDPRADLEHDPLEPFNAPQLALTGVPAYFVPGIRVKGVAEDVVMDASVVERLAAEARLMDPSLADAASALEAQTPEDAARAAPTPEADPEGALDSEPTPAREASLVHDDAKTPEQPNLLDGVEDDLTIPNPSIEQGHLHSDSAPTAPVKTRVRPRKNFLTRKHRIALPNHFWPKPWKRAYNAWRAERVEEKAYDAAE